MKFIVLATIISASYFASAQTDQIVKWYHIERAQSLTSENPRPVFVEFTADWCGWCKKMDKTTFRDQKVVTTLNSDYYSVKLDFESKVTFAFNGKKFTSKEFAKKYGIQGLPTMILFSPDLEDHSLIVGYQKSKQFLSKLEKAEM